ncbi:helix-turn-helix transcriptional regulator [Nocardioides abyssi]|uniref:Response regulator transcription factor n=1 Tax=Nocardioides abyssi TaxID=3058370 RepID=A0ABT8EQH3_9ACTN|nr:response regulator transcription factor [Nocardioides abyssi]MDN4160407.1 response regulator transcription factor [Nocardioides abyssi]
MPPQPLTVGVISPYELVLTGLTTMLRRHPARIAVSDVSGREGHPAGLDVVIFDAACLDPARSTLGGDLDHLVRGQARVVALVRPHEPTLTTSALERGVAGVVPIEASADEVVDVLARVSRGVPGRRPRQVDARTVLLPRGLTRRELEVLGLVAAGLSNVEIAERLFVSVNTVKTYVRAGYRKIGVDRRAQAVVWCARHGVVAG